MPTDLSRPIVMIGPGTGIAPFRGFWQQRKVVTPSDPVGKSKLGRLTLFFGCQTKEMILYRTELEELKEIGIFADIYLALSREPKIKKVYFGRNSMFIKQLNFRFVLDIRARLINTRRRKYCKSNIKTRWTYLCLW